MSRQALVDLPEGAVALLVVSVAEDHSPRPKRRQVEAWTVHLHDTSGAEVLDLGTGDLGTLLTVASSTVQAR